MKDNARKMSQTAEATLVLSIALGYFVVGALYSVFNTATTPHITEQHLLFLLAYETIVMGGLGVFLHSRGWTFKRLGLGPSVSDTLIGVAIAAGFQVVYVAIWLAMSAAAIRPTYLIAR